jgi:hypothetical protein
VTVMSQPHARVGLHALLHLSQCNGICWQQQPGLQYCFVWLFRVHWMMPFVQ